MRQVLISLIVASAGLSLAAPAHAMTRSMIVGGAADQPSVTLVRDGCGMGYGRGPMGMCRPNSIPVGALRDLTGGACPPTYHAGPFGNRCWSN